MFYSLKKLMEFHFDIYTFLFFRNHICRIIKLKLINNIKKINILLYTFYFEIIHNNESPGPASARVALVEL